MIESNTDRVQIGDKLYGFCGGIFGRDAYYDKIVEAVGPDWVVARDVNETSEGVHFACDDTRDNPVRSVREALTHYRFPTRDEF